MTYLFLIIGKVHCFCLLSKDSKGLKVTKAHLIDKSLLGRKMLEVSSVCKPGRCENLFCVGILSLLRMTRILLRSVWR